MPKSKNKTSILAGAIVAAVIVIFSLFQLEEVKTQNRLKEIQAQEEKELNVILERERIEQEKIDGESADREIQVWLRNNCLEEAEEDYKKYVKLNGTAEGDGIFSAPNHIWEKAREQKQDDEDVCFKKYPVK